MSKVSLKDINKIAIPAIIAGIAEPLISLTDIAIIGNVDNNSVEALAAVGLVGSFLSAIIWILAQTKTAISAMVSQHLGAHRLNAVKTLVPQTIALNFLLSLFIYTITALFSEFIFKELFEAKGQILEYSTSYYRIRALGFPLTLVTFAIFGVFRGLQNTSWAMTCSLTGGAINVVFTYLLVYGIDGLFEGLHLTGAAMGSLLAQLTMLIMALFYFFKKTPFNLKVSLKPNPQLRPLLLMSLNLFLRTLFLNIAIITSNRLATTYGNNHIAAQSILMNIWLFFSFFIDGFANAGNAIGGRLFGEKNFKALWHLSIDISKYSIVIAFALIGICGIFYENIGLVFNEDQAVLNLFYALFWIVLAMQPVNALAFVFDGIFKGLGKAKFLRNVLFFATFVGFLPTVFICDYFNLQLYGIWMGFFVWMLIRSLSLIFKFRLDYLNKE
jgi:putative MATE family efflux protein